MTFFVPFRPIHLEVTLNDGNAKLYLTLTLTLKNGIQAAESLTDLTNIGLKWASFDPLPSCNVNKVCYMIAPCGLKVGQQIPWVRIDTRDANSISRVFFQQK